MAKKSIIDELPMEKTDALRKSEETIKFRKNQSKLAKKLGGLVSADKLSEEDRIAYARLGGVAAQEKRRNTIALSSTLQMLMEMPLVDEDDIRRILTERGFDNEMLTEATAICYTQLQRAREDSKAFEVVRDTIGQKPVERQVILGNVESGAEIVRKHFGDILDE